MNADLIRRLREMAEEPYLHGLRRVDLNDAADALEAAEAEVERLKDQIYESIPKWQANELQRKLDAAEAEVARLREALSKRKMVMGDDGVPHLMTCEKCGESVGTSALHPARRDEGGSTE